jgi:hypothetical protein
MLRVFNDTARYTDQGAESSFAIYIETWQQIF